MHKKTKAMLDQIDKDHDWAKGQTRSSGGTRYFSTDKCRICGLQREYFSDEQNGIEPQYTFTDRGGNEPSLLELLQEPCLDKEDAQ